MAAGHGAVSPDIATVWSVTQRSVRSGPQQAPHASAQGSADDSGFTLRAVVTWTRRVLLVALVAWAARELLVDGLPRVCEDEVTEGAVVTVCHAMSVADPRVGLFLLIVGLLLLPDLSQLEVAGVVKLQRKVEAARTEVAELTGELVGVRNQLSSLAAASAASAAQSSSSGNTMSLTVTAQAAETGAALQDISSGDTTILEPEEEEGTFGLLAFDAAMRGLLGLLPRGGDRGAVIGMTFDDNGDLTWHAQTGADADGAAVEQLIDQARELPDILHIVTDGDWWSATAPATVAEGQVGAVGVLLPFHPVDGGDARDQAARQADEVGEATALVAGTYGRMLVALLGEQLVSIQGRPPEEGQV